MHTSKHLIKYQTKQTFCDQSLLFKRHVNYRNESKEILGRNNKELVQENKFMDSLCCLMLHPKSRSFVIILSYMLGSLFHCAFLETLQKSHTSKSAFLTMKKWTMPFPSLKRQGGLFKINLVYCIKGNFL